MAESRGELAAALRAARTTHGWSQAALAARAGVHLSTVADIEAGRIRRPHNRTLASLAAALALRSADLARVARRDAAARGLRGPGRPPTEC
ncbi:MAG TPA: helix-turn-helix transcriptional regulator [Thermomicrobiales bacterium]|nr:helix-turn-helix transcriptional regulator [Thermomicrobiales bacterium]